MGGRVILHDSPAGGGVDGGVRRGFRELLLDAACTFMSIVRFATGPKRSMGHLLRGDLHIFLIRDRVVHGVALLLRDRRPEAARRVLFPLTFGCHFSGDEWT